MEKEIVLTHTAPAPIGPYSQAVKAGNLLFVSGQIPLDPSSGILLQATLEEETELVLKNLRAILAQAGSDFDKVLKTSIFLKDMNDFAVVNGIYGKYFTQNPPARETVEVSRLPKDARIEISCVALV